MPSIDKTRAELIGVTKIARLGGEDEQSFLARLLGLARELSDPQWRKLSEPAQRWYNEAVTAEENHQALPGLGELPDPPAEGDTPAAQGKSGKKPNTATAASGAAEPSTSTETDVKKSSKKSGAKKASASGAAKSAAKKLASKSASKSGAKAAAASKSSGRPSVFAADAKIKVLAKTNPFREGSNSAKVFAMYTNGMTVGDFEKKVAKGDWRSTPKMFLRVHVNKNLISVG